MSSRGKDVHEYIELALNTGFCHIDTAQCDLNFLVLRSLNHNLIFCYEGYENEESIPIAIRESGLARSDLYITTKYGGGDLEETIRESLNKVQ